MEKGEPAGAVSTRRRRSQPLPRCFPPQAGRGAAGGSAETTHLGREREAMNRKDPQSGPEAHAGQG